MDDASECRTPSTYASSTQSYNDRSHRADEVYKSVGRDQRQLHREIRECADRKVLHPPIQQLVRLLELLPDTKMDKEREGEAKYLQPLVSPSSTTSRRSTTPRSTSREPTTTTTGSTATAEPSSSRSTSSTSTATTARCTS